MLRSFVILALGAVLANSAMADQNVIGRSELLIQSDAHGSSASDFTETLDGRISGQGGGLPGNNNIVSLERQAGGVKGQVYGRFFNITCKATNCVDNGATNLNVTVTSSNGVTHLDGLLAFNFVHVAYSADMLSISTNSATFQMNRLPDGKLSGNGAYSDFTLNPSFEAMLSGSGSLQGIAQDPALILAVLVSPFCDANQ
jgi:hypothetical protein